MRVVRALLGLALLMAPAACDRREPSAAPPQAAAPTGPSVWFICDGVDAPSIFVLTKDAAGANVTIAEYDKRTGAETTRDDYTLGAPEGAAGSVYTPLLRDGADAAFVRAFNPGVLDAPTAAYTTPFSSVKLGERTVSCRWLARTRLMGFTARRSLVVYEDADGDLIYTTFNFEDAATAPAIDLSEGQRSTTFSLEVRDGAESLRPDGAEFRLRTPATNIA